MPEYWGDEPPDNEHHPDCIDPYDWKKCNCLELEAGDYYDAGETKWEAKTGR